LTNEINIKLPLETSIFLNVNYIIRLYFCESQNHKISMLTVEVVGKIAIYFFNQNVLSSFMHREVCFVIFWACLLPSALEEVSV